MKNNNKMTNRLIVTMLSLLMLFSAGPFFFADNMSAYADGVNSWSALRTAINNGGEQTIILSDDFSYDGSSIEISSGKNITIKGSHTIYSTATPSEDAYGSMFVVMGGGKLTIDNGVTLSAKTSAQGCAGDDTYTADKFTGKVSSDGKTYDPKGFFIQVESGGTATLNGTISDFVTSRKKDETPRYVAPVVANGNNATFNVGSNGVIKNNLVGYIVNNNMANNDAQTIKQYVKGAGPNVPRVPKAEIQKANKDSFDRERKKDALIDEGVPGTGITATAGAVIYKDGAQGTITGGTITNNRADTGGIMVSGEGTEVTISDVEISKNVGVQFGGGSTAEQGGVINMSGGKMEYNVAWFGGGAVYATENGVAWLLGLMNGEDGLSPQFDDRLDGEFNMSGGSLNNNTALTRGGAILADSDAVHVTAGKLQNNMSRMLGGAVYVMGDHPQYTYTMHLTGLYVHDNTAVSGIADARQAAANGPNSKYTRVQLDTLNNKLQTKLNPPNPCGDVSEDILGDVFELPNSDDMNDGWGTHGTGGGVWLCAYGTTYFDAGATDKVVIADNYATGAVPLSNSVYPQWIRRSSDGKTIREDIAYNTANSVATGTGRTGGNDIHADTGDSGKVVIKNVDQYTGWMDENASTSENMRYLDPVSEGRVNMVNVGPITKMENAFVDVSGNVARRGGGLAADGTFMLGMSDDQATMESAMQVSKAWASSAAKKPVAIRVNAQSGTNAAVVADVPLDGEANAPVTEFDTIEELAPTGNTWNGRFKLPIELNGSEGKIKVFTLVLDEAYREDGDTDGKIDPTTYDGRVKLAAAIKSIKNKYRDHDTGEVDEEAAMAELRRALTVSFNDDLQFTCEEYEMEYDNEAGVWTIKMDGGQPVKSNDYIFTSENVDLSKATFELQSTSYYGQKTNTETGEVEEVEIFQVHLFGINLTLNAQNDNTPITEKYVNKEVHSDIINFDQDFEYDIMAYVPLTAEEFTISDTLVNGLEFAGPAGNANTNPNQVVRSIAVKTLNNHEPGEEGSVSGPGEPGRNGNPMNLMPGQSPMLPGGKTINVNTSLNITGKTLTVHVPAGDTLDFLKGKWVQVTFGARIEDNYRSLDALKDLSAGVAGKDKSWEGTATNKKGDPASTYLVANGDKAIVAPILAEVGPDPVIWAVEAPSRLFARTANGDYYATPMDNKTGSTWTRLDKDLDDGDDSGYGKPVWINADNRYYGRAPHASNTRRQLGLDDSELNSLKTMPLVVGSEVVKAAEGATRYFAEVKDAEDKTHIWATDKGDVDNLQWHEVTDTSSDEYIQAMGRLSNDRYTIRMLDLTSDTVTLDPDSETGKNWPVISAEEHEGMANQANYSVKFGNNAEAKTYKTNTVTVAPETTELDVVKTWEPDNKWPDDVKSVTFNIYSKKDGVEKKVYVDGDGKVVGAFADGDTNIPSGAEALTVTLTKDDPDTDADESKTTVKDLPKLKGTIYVARETSITDGSEKTVEVNYTDDAKKVGATKLGEEEDSPTVVSTSKTTYKGNGAKLKKIADKAPTRGAIADDRLWAIALNGDYYFTAEGDTDGTKDSTEWTRIKKPDANAEPDKVKNYERAKELLGEIGAKPETVTGATQFEVTRIFTETNSIATTEKYVNDDVHADLGEFDKAFKYDIMVYVPAGSTHLTITDPLKKDVLEFAKKMDSIEVAEDAAAEKTTDPAETIASVVYKDTNDHIANSSVAEEGTAIAADDYTASIENNTLTLSFVGADTDEADIKEPLAFAGKWVQVTFWAKYTDEVIQAADAGTLEDVTDNGPVISEVYPSKTDNDPVDYVAHSGTLNNATANIKVNNTAEFDVKTNEVTVRADDESVWVQKKLVGRDGETEMDWPDGLEIDIDVKRVIDGNEENAKTVDTIKVKSADVYQSKKFPKLIGATYTADEVKVPENFERVGGVTGKGTKEDPFVITNKDIRVDVEVTKIWENAVMDDIPSAEDFKSMLVLKNGAGKPVSNQHLNKLKVTTNGRRYTAKWSYLPNDEYTVDELDVPGFGTSIDGDTITNTKKPQEEKPEIEKYVNQAVHKDIMLGEVFTYDIIAYITKDADSVTITDTLNDVLKFESAAKDIKVVDLGESDNHLVTNNIQAVKVNDNATVADDGTAIEDAEVSIDGQTLKVFITNKLKKTTVSYNPVEVEFTNPKKEGYFEEEGDGFKPTEDTKAVPNKKYYVEEGYKDAEVETGDDVSGLYVLNDGEYVLTEDTDAQDGVTYYKPDYIEVTIPAVHPKEKGYYEKDGDEYVETQDTVADPEKTYYAKEAVEEGNMGYEYDGDDQPVLALRGHWVKVTFDARIKSGLTVEDVKKAFAEINSDQVEDRAEENKGNAPVVSTEDHTGIPNDASYTIGVANEAGIKEDSYGDSSNTVTVKPKAETGGDDVTEPDDEDEDAKPDNDEEGDDGKDNSKVKGADTGDDTETMPWMLLFIASAAAVTTGAVYRRKRSR